MNKKVLIIIISAVMALAVMLAGIIAIIKGFDKKNTNNDTVSKQSVAQNEENSSDTLEKGKISINKIGAKVGQAIEVPINIKQNPGMWGGQLVFKYDTEMLDYVDFAAGQVFDECNVNEKSDGTIFCVATCSAAEDVKTNGTIVTLKFIPKPASKGKEVKVDILDSTNFTNLEEVLIKPEFQDIIINVE